MGSGFDIQSAQLVLDGNFNPYLISPEWLDDQNIWKAVNLRLALGAIKDGVQFQDESIEWSVASNHLVISSVDVDCGKLAVEVLNRLPHTPMRSVRADFVFHSNSTDATRPIFGAMEKSPLGKIDTDLLTAGAIFHKGNSRIEVRLVEGEEGVTISVHFLRQAPSVSSAETAANVFEEDKSESLSILDRVLN